MSIQDRLDALVARASTDEPTEEARTSAWIAIKVMREHGGAIRVAPEPARRAAPDSYEDAWVRDGFRHAHAHAQAPARDTDDGFRVVEAAESARCWSCGTTVPAGRARAVHRARSPLCVDCYARDH